MAQYEMGLRDYWRILRKRKLVIILTCLAAGGLTYYLTQHVFKRPPQFMAKCEVSVRAAEVVGERPPMRPPNIAQQAKVAKSEMLIRETIWAIEHYPHIPKDAQAEQKKLRAAILAALEPLDRPQGEKLRAAAVKRLAETRDLACLFSHQATDPDAAWILEYDKQQRNAAGAGGRETKVGYISDKKELLETVITNFQYAIGKIEYDLMTTTFELTVTTTAPDSRAEGRSRGREAAARLAETLATVYEAYTEWEGNRAVSRQIERMDRDIARLENEKQQLEKDFQSAQTAGGEYDEARAVWRAAEEHVNSLKIYRDQLDRYLARRDAIKSAPGARQAYPPIPAPVKITDANIAALYGESTKFEKEKNDKLEFHKADSHAITALDEKIERTAGQLRKVVEGSIQNEESRAKLAGGRFDEAKEKLPLTERAAVESLMLKIQNTNASIIALRSGHSRLERFESQGIKVDIIGGRGTAEELGQAGAPAKTAAGALIGLMLGIVVAVLWETLDLTMGTIEEVESYLDTRVLGVIPHVDAGRLAADIRARDPEAGEADLLQRAMLVTLYEPKGMPAEAFRHVRTSLDVARQQSRSDAKVFLVTSATLCEGKTTVAANLAVVMAQNGKRTCLVECDLRRPQLHRFFGIERSPGLHDVFIGRTSWQDAKRSLSDLLLGKIGMDAAVSMPGIENLSILTCGMAPPNPVELLDSAEARGLFAQLRDAFDVVIVDSPPNLPVADAAVVSPLVDGAILVYRAGAAPRTVLGRAKTELESIGTPLFGVVLNDLRPTAGDLSATYPYKGYARKPYAAPDEEPAPRVAVALAEEAAAGRTNQDTEDQALRKIDLCLLQGKVEQAVETAHEAARSMPESMSVRLELARAYAAAGRVGEAQAELLNVLDMDPRNLQALERLAEMAVDGGLEREALRWYEEILEFAPENARAGERAGEIRARIGGAEAETV
ncbi:MAG: AAA family ATPase [Planctomycetota bacterium]